MSCRTWKDYGSGEIRVAGRTFGKRAEIGYGGEQPGPKGFVPHDASSAWASGRDDPTRRRQKAHSSPTGGGVKIQAEEAMDESPMKDMRLNYANPFRMRSSSDPERGPL